MQHVQWTTVSRMTLTVRVTTNFFISQFILIRKVIRTEVLLKNLEVLVTVSDWTWYISTLVHKFTKQDSDPLQA